jgi:cob(I)alamin adenosyltransferase
MVQTGRKFCPKGSLDEINSFLGLAKIKSKEATYRVGGAGEPFEVLVHQIQQQLFIIQAELAGAKKTIEEVKIRELEQVINLIEKELPPIKTFFISGGTELAALFDVARTLARRAERRVVTVVSEGERVVGEHTLAYLNRLSSMLYALARLSNHKAKISEEAPDYQ